MSASGRIPTKLDGRPIIPPPGATRQSMDIAGHRQLEMLRHPELLETKIAAQVAEINQLIGDNQRLGSTHAVLREELATAQQEVQRLKAHIRSIQTESDIQIRVLVDKVARAEASIRAGEGLRNELELAIKEAQSYVADRQVLKAKIQEATEGLQRARDDIKSLPNLRSELDSLRKEHQRLRSTFEYEKGSNIEQVEQLQAMEQKLISMCKEVEKLKVDVINAEKRANSPQPLVQANSAFANHLMARANSYGASRIVVPPTSSALHKNKGAAVAAMSTHGSAGASGSTSGKSDMVKEGKSDPGEGDGCISDDLKV